MRVAASVSGRGGRPDELQRGVNAVGYDVTHGGRNLTCIHNGIIDAMFREHLDAIRASRGREDGRPEVLGKRGGGQTKG